MQKEYSQNIHISTMKFPLWQWLALITYVLMEMSWLVPWMQSLSMNIYLVNSFLLILVSSIIVLLNVGVIKTAELLSLNTGIQRWLSGLILGVDLLIGLNFLMTGNSAGATQEFLNRRLSAIEEFFSIIPAWFWVTIIVIGLWWWSLQLAKQRIIGPMTVFSKFRIGIVMFAIFAMASLLVPLAKAINPYGELFTFIGCGLISLVASRVSILSRLRGGGQSPFDRRWMLAVFLSVLFFTLLAYGIGTLATGQSEAFLGMVTGFMVFIGAVFAAPILLVLYLIEPSVDAIRESLPTPGLEATPTPMPEMGELGSSGTGGFITANSIFNLTPELRIVLILIGIVAVVIFLIWSFRWISRTGRSNENGIQTEYILENKDILNMIREMFKRQLDQTTSGLRDRTKLSQKEKIIAAEKVRTIYSKLLEHAAQIGYPRQNSVTPLEFQSDLFQAFPNGKNEVVLITSAYVKIRYGQFLETQDEVSRIEAAWTVLEKYSESN